MFLFLGGPFRSRKLRRRCASTDTARRACDGVCGARAQRYLRTEATTPHAAHARATRPVLQ